MKRRTMLFEQFNQANTFNLLVESVSGEIKDVQDEVKDVMDELGKEGAQDDELKAAILLQALDNDGDIEKVDVDRLKKDVKEGMADRGFSLNEAAGPVIHTIELIGNVAGNADLVHWIIGKIEKTTGKKIDADKATKTVAKIAGVLKKISGLPAKALIKFFDWISEKLGIGGDSAKKFNLAARIVVLAAMFILGATHFPVLGTGIIFWLLSLTGLIGKGIEIAHLGKELYKEIKGAETKPEEFKDETGIKPDELEAMIA